MFPLHHRPHLSIFPPQHIQYFLFNFISISYHHGQNSLLQSVFRLKLDATPCTTKPVFFPLHKAQSPFNLARIPPFKIDTGPASISLAQRSHYLLDLNLSSISWSCHAVFPDQHHLYQQVSPAASHDEVSCCPTSQYFLIRLAGIFYLSQQVLLNQASISCSV